MIDFLTAMSYWVLIGLWTNILVLYVINYQQAKHSGGLLVILQCRRNWHPRKILIK